MAKQTTAATVAEIGVGVAAAAAAGYYFYVSEDAKKHRKIAAAWTKGFKNEVVREAQKLKKLDAKDIAAAVDTAVAAYQGVRSVGKEDLKQAARELKTNWELLKQEATKKKPRKARAKVVKRKTSKSS